MNIPNYFLDYDFNDRLNGYRNAAQRVLLRLNLEDYHLYDDQCYPQLGDSCYPCSLSYIFLYMIETGKLYE